MPTSFVGPFFSYPYNSRGEVEDLRMDATVHARLADLFAGITTTTIVRGSLYIWLYEDFGLKQTQMSGPVVSSPKAFTDAVHAALVRSGATNVHFIVDQKYVNTATRNAFSKMSFPVTEDASSSSDDGILHSKFFTFSELQFAPGAVPGGFPARMTHVVAVLSANVDNAMYRAANNLLIMYGNAILYQTFVDLWNYINTHPNARRADATSRLCGDVYVWSFPRSSDTIVRILDKVAKEMGPRNPPRIRVAMYLFTRTEIRDRLIDLARNGADVKVVLSSYSHKGNKENRDLENRLDAHGVKARLLPNRTVGVMHSKYLLVDARYELEDATRRRRIVWTGSHNYTGAALAENDEVLIRVTDSAVYTKYLNDWNRLWDLAGS
jgi:hypothetical protein